MDGAAVRPSKFVNFGNFLSMKWGKCRRSRQRVAKYNTDFWNLSCSQCLCPVALQIAIELIHCDDEKSYGDWPTALAWPTAGLGQTVFWVYFSGSFSKFFFSFLALAFPPKDQRDFWRGFALKVFWVNSAILRKWTFLSISFSISTFNRRNDPPGGHQGATGSQKSGDCLLFFFLFFGSLAAASWVEVSVNFPEHKKSIIKITIKEHNKSSRRRRCRSI